MEKYKDLTIKEANEYYYKACEKNDLASVKYLVENYKDLDLSQRHSYPKKDIEQILFSNNFFEIIKYLIEEKNRKEIFTDHYSRKDTRQLTIHVMWSIGEKNHMDLLKYMVEKYRIELNKKEMQYSLDTCLRAASCGGHLEMVKYLLLSPELPVNPKLNEDNYFPFQLAAEGGHIDLVRFFLLSPELKIKPKVSTYNQHAVRYAAWKDHLPMVEYLLTSPELSEKADIHSGNESVLHAAIRNENIEMMKFVLSSPKLTEHADLHIKNDLLFRKAVKENKFLALQYLICDYEIEKSAAIEKAIKKRLDIQKMFEMGKSYKKLMTNLPLKENKNKVEKI